MLSVRHFPLFLLAHGKQPLSFLFWELVRSHSFNLFPFSTVHSFFMFFPFFSSILCSHLCQTGRLLQDCYFMLCDSKMVIFWHFGAGVCRPFRQSWSMETATHVRWAVSGCPQTPSSIASTLSSSLCSGDWGQESTVVICCEMLWYLQGCRSAPAVYPERQTEEPLGTKFQGLFVQRFIGFTNIASECVSKAACRARQFLGFDMAKADWCGLNPNCKTEQTVGCGGRLPRISEKQMDQQLVRSVDSSQATAISNRMDRMPLHMQHAGLACRALDHLLCHWYVASLATNRCWKLFWIHWHFWTYDLPTEQYLYLPCGGSQAIVRSRQPRCWDWHVAEAHRAARCVGWRTLVWLVLTCFDFELEGFSIRSRQGRLSTRPTTGYCRLFHFAAGICTGT